VEQQADRQLPARLTRARVATAVATPLLAVVTALVLGAVIILVTGGAPLLAYRGLWEGAFGSARAISDTLVATNPYILGGLAVALAFKGGLFNIGGEGQILVGALCSVWVGYAVPGIPFPLHLLVAMAAGVLGGALWGAIPGVLRAYTGAHEVIVTIMLNYVAIQITSFLLSGPMKDPNPLIAVAQTPKVLESARLPTILPGYRVHWGVVLALACAVGCWWLINKTTIGFRIRTVGANVYAARYAGIDVGRTIVLTMTLSGALAGLAGAIEVLGVNYYHTPGFSVGYGFNSIAVALLGRADPLGVVPAAFLFGALANGATRMQFLSQIPIDIIGLIQGLILIFVSAPSLIRWLWRIRVPAQAPDELAAEEATFSTGWGRAEP
jgi:general nucleoside transport system permease protein